MADTLVPPPLPEGWTVERLRAAAAHLTGGPFGTGLTYWADALDAQARQPVEREYLVTCAHCGEARHCPPVATAPPVAQPDALPEPVKVGNGTTVHPIPDRLVKVRQPTGDAQPDARHNFGKAWWDFGDAPRFPEGLAVGVEVENPPTHEHFLCFIPYTGDDASKAIEAAEYLVALLRAAGEGT